MISEIDYYYEEEVEYQVANSKWDSISNSISIGKFLHETLNLNFSIRT